MAETDILNPQQGYWAALNDNPNPSYGFTRKTNSNSLLSRTRMGTWNQRDNANAGYAFPMSFMSRPWTTMLRLKQFYEIGKRGYFTFIDYDGGGRHHVGRFTTEPDPIQIANGKYNCQNLIFEELPQARMATYPADFANWGSTINIVDDFLRLAPSYQGNWSLRQIPGTALATTKPASYELWNPTPLGGVDFAQVQYVGWGFHMTFPRRSTGGQCNILLDGQTVVTGLDLYDGSYVANAGYSFINPLGPSLSLSLPTTPAAGIFGDAYPYSDTAVETVTVELTGVPLDAHRVKVVALNTKNAGSTGYEVVFPAVQVIV